MTQRWPGNSFFFFKVLIMEKKTRPKNYLSDFCHLLRTNHTTITTNKMNSKPEQAPVTIHFQLVPGLSLAAITILAVVWWRDASTAPPVVLSSWTQTTLSGASSLSLSTLTIKESFHCPSDIVTFPDVGHSSFTLCEDSFWYRDQCTVTSPTEPFARRTGISSSVTCLVRETSRTPSLLYTIINNKF